jgi:hypothetical protein
LHELVDDFHVRQSLFTGTHFVLTFDDQNATGFQHSPQFASGGKVELQNGFVVLCTSRVASPVVLVVVLKILMINVRSPTRRMHVGRIEHAAVKTLVLIRQLATVHTCR